MKKSRSKAGAAKKPAPAPATAKKPKTRREALTSIASWGAIGLAVAGVGYWTVGSVRATISEQDLSKIGNGTPAIVQIHDPNCPMCTALQNEALDALESFEDGSYTYLVANIRTSEGRSFANMHGVEHVTLMIFDGQGEVQEILHGQNHSARLVEEFRRHIGEPAS